MKAIGYIRVSTEERARKGVPIDNQIKRKLSTPRLKPKISLIGFAFSFGFSFPLKSTKFIRRLGAFGEEMSLI